MKLAAIESSGLVASVAILSDGVLLAEYSVDYKKTHSQTLLPMFEEIVQMTETDPKSLDAIAISAGPGSFTGLRIGSATAKGLGLALDIPLVEVPTLQAMAYQAYGFAGLVCPMMDARRGQVYTGLYGFDKEGFPTEVVSQQVCGCEEMIARINEAGERVLLMGEGSDVYRQKIEEGLSVPFAFAPPHMARQRAGAVASLGAGLFAQGKVISSDQHAPVYLRLSQAERELKEKQAAAGQQSGNGS
ncbi:MAG: tRNA (adenosine(37)-N6)-threonylcarbamoyltransferase complex dimerization subunit type 1 TsaB [Lachnospiraceae bacterium]|nr:tRNA (adenosine(37)-N6)-threonylcarbamoyltransferase complex dimerization subunit type 1 TsaB [Lachnospiraceae bacterium]